MGFYKEIQWAVGYPFTLFSLFSLFSLFTLFSLFSLTSLSFSFVFPCYI